MVENMSALEQSMFCQQMYAIYQAYMGTDHLNGHPGWPYETMSIHSANRTSWHAANDVWSR